jgi:hypothetical protein
MRPAFILPSHCTSAIGATRVTAQEIIAPQSTRWAEPPLETNAPDQQGAK